MSSPSSATLVSYVSSPHAGYLKFFRKYEGGTLFVLGRELISEFPSLVRHLPGNTPEEVRTMIQALNIFSYVEVLDKGRIVTPRIQNLREIFMPDEDVSHAIAETYFSGARVVFDGSWRLRWDWNSVAHLKRPEAEGTVSVDELDRTMMRQAFKAAERSTDWWRQVGALLSKDGKPLLTAFNKHQPSEQNPYLYGDPRSQFDAGEMIEMSTALHGEVGIAAQAARRGIATEGLDLYVTTFPCPPCAYAIAEMGIKRLFYAEGYSRLEGEAALLAANVEIIRVDMDE